MIVSEIPISGKLQSEAAEISARVRPSVGTSFGWLGYLGLRAVKGMGEEQGGAKWGMGTPPWEAQAQTGLQVVGVAG